jgi:hypothetical protein
MEALVDYRDENGEDPTPEELIAQIEGLEDEDEE